MGLGINKDLEPLVRATRRAGGSVEVTGSNHVRWTMPDGEVIRTGLTMNSRSARNAQRQIGAALEALRPAEPTVAAQAVAPTVQWRLRPAERGKFHLVDDGGQVMTNAAGYPRTFSSEQAAKLVAGEQPPRTSAP